MNRKRKLFLVALLSVSVAGCTSLPNRQQSIAKDKERQKWLSVSNDSGAWDAVQVEAPELSGGDGVRPVGYQDGVVIAAPDTLAGQQADGEAPAVTLDGDPVLPGPMVFPEPEAMGIVQPVSHFVDLAMSQHPSILAARHRVSAELNRIPQVRALPDPVLKNTFLPIHDQALQTAAGRVGNQMSLSQGIPWPEKLRTRAAVVSQEVQIAQAEVDRIEREIRESVKLAYYEVWYATRAIAIVQEIEILINDLTKVAEARYRSGGTQQDVLRARLESDRLQDQLVVLNRQKQVAQADLAALVQQPVTLLAEAKTDLGLAGVPEQLDDLITLAEACNPELRGLAWEIQRDRQNQRLARLERYPDLQVGLGWSYVDDDHKALSGRANGRDTFSFNVGTTLPIWHDKINAGMREAAHRTSSSIRRLDAERDALYGELRRLLAQADAFTEQGEIFEKRIIPRTEDTLKLSIADYRGKRTEFFTLIETYRELLTFETQLARINASLAGTVARIERAVGCE